MNDGKAEAKTTQELFAVIDPWFDRRGTRTQILYLERNSETQKLGEVASVTIDNKTSHETAVAIAAEIHSKAQAATDVYVSVHTCYGGTLEAQLYAQYICKVLPAARVTAFYAASGSTYDDHFKNGGL